MTAGEMTKAERRELSTLARKRARVLKAATAERRAELMADFEGQISAIYSPNDDAMMARLYEAASSVVEEADQQLRARCRELGIPDRFAPEMCLSWYGRGENALASRRAELRTAMRSRLDHLEKRARTEIDRACLETETKLITAGLTTDAARKFLAEMPSLEELMPRLDTSEIAHLLPGLAEELPPLALIGEGSE